MSTIALPDRYIRDGNVTFTPGRPHGLLPCVETAPEGEEIHLRGTLFSADWAGAPGKAQSIVAKTHPIDVKITGLGGNDEGAVMRASLFNDKNKGIDRIAIRDMNMVAAATQYPFVSVQNPRPGKLVFRRCRFTAPSNATPGNRVLSFVRSYNHELVMTQVRAYDADEYGIGYATGSKFTIKDVSATDCGRGVFQGTVRNVEGEMNGVPLTNLKLSPDDVCEISGVVAKDCGFGGSSAISITGHPGTVRISNLDIQSKWETGAIALRYNTKQNQQEPNVHWKYARAIDRGRINEDLRAHLEVVLNLEGSTIRLPDTDREPILCDSSTKLTIASDEDTIVTSPRAALSLEENGHGFVKCPGGFPKAGENVARKDIEELVMLGEYYGWKRTSNYNRNKVFLRRNAAFGPAEYYSPRGA